MRRGRGLAGLAIGLLIALPVTGQDAPTPVSPTPAPPADSARTVESPVLTVDQERLFSASAWGKRANAEIEAAFQTLATENRRIEADLAAEEKALTDKRATLTPEAFRTEADAFDARVVSIRKAQDAKQREIATSQDAERKAFFSAVLPSMAEVMMARGAVAILDARAIFVNVNAIDVTDEMIARIDATFGSGPADAIKVQPEPQPSPSPAPTPPPPTNP